MKLHVPIALALALFAAGPAAAQPAPPGVEGDWEGEAETKLWPLFLSLHLEAAPGGTAGRLAVLGQEIALSPGEAAAGTVRVRYGEGASALVLEMRRDGDLLRGRLKQGADDLPFALRRVPAYPKPANRIEGWRQDLAALRTRFLAADRSFTARTRAEFLRKVDAIDRALPRLDDAQVTMRIAAALATADNAHTRLYLLRNRTELRRMPIRLWWFADGLRVVRAQGPYRDLVGCRVDTVAGVPARKARDMVAPAFAGSPGWKDYMSVYSLTSPEALHGMGVTKAAAPVAYGVSDCAAANPRRIVEPLPLARSKAALESWWDLSPNRPAGEAWAHVLPAGPTPLYLSDPQAYYWSRFLPESGILYVQLNRAANMADAPIAAFADSVMKSFGGNPVKAIVVDLRFNTGGDANLAAPLLRRLEEASRALPRFVITGRTTFSAGISHVAFLRQAGRMTIVGEPAGDRMDFWAEGGNIVLPYSGYAAHFANGAHSYSPAPCPTPTPCMDLSAPSIDPDIKASPTWRDYLARRDPAMEAIEARLVTRSSAARSP